MIIWKVVSAENQGTFSDYHSLDEGGQEIGVGYTSYSESQGGLYYNDDFKKGRVWFLGGSRLSKN